MDMIVDSVRFGVKRIFSSLLISGLIAVSWACAATPVPVPLREAAYTYSCWLNGLRKNTSDTTPALFAIETSHYGFTLDLGDFGKAGFAARGGKVAGYAESLASGTEWLRNLPPSGFIMEVEVEGRIYRARSCKAGVGSGKERFQSVRLWESGRFVQHYEFLDLDLRDPGGAVLSCKASLNLVAWPGSLTLTGSISPAGTSVWHNARFRLGLQGKAIDCVTEKTFEGNWNGDEVKDLTVSHCPGAGGPPPVATPPVHVSCDGGQDFPVVFDPRKDCWVASVPDLKRTFKKGNTDIRHYDDFAISIVNEDGIPTEIPFLLDLRSVANITGLCPMLCDKEGRPTGIPVQLSKNWHNDQVGAYLMAYTSLPAKPGKTGYILRIAYGFYGSVPSASHAQLSLVGYGGNGRWDQLAIGCWGETFCFDMDMTCVDIAITDVRMLMARNGINGEKWAWTDAGWGGDWLGMNDDAGEKLPFSGLRTAYLAHGPCLSDVRHSGFYGAGKEVSLDAMIRTVRTDDYARTFQKFKYTFNATSKTDGVWFHKMGRTSRYVTPQVAYGNRDGLIAERNVSGNLKPKALFEDLVTLAGNAPWWVAFPGGKSIDGRDWGTGYRALVIRSYKARFGRKSYSRPTISLPVHTVEKDGAGLNLDLLLVAPKEVTEFHPGDTVEMDLEWITLPRCGDDYYGPNETFRKHLTENPSSWKTTYREAIGNDLRVTARGGTVLNRYPIVIHADNPTVEIKLKGGVGFVPIRFEGLESVKEITLFEVVDGKEIRFDQSVHGNDFWQTDYDEGRQSYHVTYSLPLDGKAASTWRLKFLRH